MILAELLNHGETCLEDADIGEAKLNAWYLFSFCFKMDRNHFFLHSNQEAEQKETEMYMELLEQRKQHIPLEYITHETEFMGLPFYVNENVLIPRQDTECIVEEVLCHSKEQRILDMCTGSGCIGISLAVLGMCKEVTCVDFSHEALQVTKMNAEQNHVSVCMVESDLFEKVEGSYDIIVSNPPYISSREIDILMPEVRDHEPRMALDGAEDGLRFYRIIIRESLNYLSENGWLFFEIGYDQGQAVCEMMHAAGFSEIEIKKDLAGLNRIVLGQKQ